MRFALDGYLHLSRNDYETWCNEIVLVLGLALRIPRSYRSGDFCLLMSLKRDGEIELDRGYYIICLLYAWCIYIKPGQLNLFNGIFLTGNRNLPLSLSEPSVKTPVKLLKQKQRCIYALSSCVMKTR